jgi:hypothetical protein
MTQIEPAVGAKDVELFHDQQAVEKEMFRHVFKSMALAIPLCVGIFVGLVALAISNTTQAVLPALGVGALVGVPAGVFFGGAVGFLIKADSLDKLDEAANQH